MATEVRYNPQFHANKETRGIITTDHMNLNVEVPNEFKNLIRTAKTNLSSKGVSFQSVNTNKFIDGSMRFDLRCKLVFAGKTFLPSATGGTAGNPIGTPPYFWSSKNCGIENFALNKLINRITFNIQNKSWTEEERNSELFDMISSQFDLKKCRDIFGIDIFKNTGVSVLDRIHGRGGVTRGDLNTIGIDVGVVGCETSIAQRPVNESEYIKQNRLDYYTINSVKFSTTQVGVTLGSRKDMNYDNAYVPYNTSTNSTYWSGANSASPNVLTQEVDITIHEYLISPSLSNPYTKVPFSKSYYVGNYPVNITMDFNSTYIAQMFKLLTPTFLDVATASQATLVSTEFTDASLLMTTFNTSKTISGNYQRTLYYEMASQTVGQVKLKKINTDLQQSRITTSNLSSLPPYIMGAVPTRMAENSALVAAYDVPNNNVSCLATAIFNKIENLKIAYGSQTDCMLGTQLTWKEIVDLTQEVVQNGELQDALLGQGVADYSLSMFNFSDAGANFSQVTPANGDDFFIKSKNTEGVTFFIIPTAKLNWRPIAKADMPVIPEFNFGSNEFKSLDIEIQWRLANDFNTEIVISENPDIYCQPVLYLCRKRVRSIPVSGDGSLFDDKVEYDFVNDYSRLSQSLEKYFVENDSANEAQTEINYVGGSFIGDVWSKVKRFLPHVATAVRGVHALTKGREGLLGHVGTLTGLASKGLAVLGHGKSRPVGRPRH